MGFVLLSPFVLSLVVISHIALSLLKMFVRFPSRQKTQRHSYSSYYQSLVIQDYLDEESW